jgi:hypothetical protein
MDAKRLYVDGKLLCQGIERAAARTEDPILCLIKEQKVTLITLSGLRLVVSREARLPEPVPTNLVFLVPPLVAELLSSKTICEQVGVELRMQGQGVIARLTDHLGSYELRWKSDFASFNGPELFAQLIQTPRPLVSVPHIRFSDAAHQAVAKLGYMQADRQIHPNKVAILIDLKLGRLLVDGEEISSTARHQYFFDPRLVIRALEFLREDILRVGLTPLPGTQRRAYLSLVSREGEWSVHCSLLSIGQDTQRLYPLPPRQSR